MTIPAFLIFAARELRGGVRGFRVFLACLALGVAAIAAAGSTAEAFRQGLASEAREILGGDLAVTIDQRRFTPAERAAFDHQGKVAYAVSARAMAETKAGDRRLVELQASAPPTPCPAASTCKAACPWPRRWSPSATPRARRWKSRCSIASA